MPPRSNTPCSSDCTLVFGYTAKTRLGSPPGIHALFALRSGAANPSESATSRLRSLHRPFARRLFQDKLREAGWNVVKDRVERIWRREGLKVPQKQKPRRRLWLNNGSCVRLGPEHQNHVWSYDFVSHLHARWEDSAYAKSDR